MSKHRGTRINDNHPVPPEMWKSLNLLYVIGDVQNFSVPGLHLTRSGANVDVFVIIIKKHALESGLFSRKD